MMNKLLCLITIPVLTMLIFLIGIFVYNKIINKEKYNSNTVVCLEKDNISIPENLLNIVNRHCITEYNSTENGFNVTLILEHLTYPELLYAIKQTDWGNARINESYINTTFTSDNEEMNVRYQNEKVIISLTKLKDKKTEPPDSSIPQVKPKDEYKVTSTEISRINTTEKIVVFTFDGGSGTQSLDKIIFTLKKYNIKATFFVTGKWAETNVTALKKISDAGYEVFNHTYSHTDLTTLTVAEITNELDMANLKISSVTGKTTKPFYRPPYGARNSSVREIAAAHGYQTVYWSIDALDWKESEGITEESVKGRIMNNLAPGNIYLMHIGDNITGNILDDVISQILSRGYKIKSLSEMLIK